MSDEIVVRVMVVPDGAQWSALGLEVDYGTQGETAERAMDMFVRGLRLTYALPTRASLMQPCSDPWTWEEFFGRTARGDFSSPVTRTVNIPKLSLTTLRFFVAVRPDWRRPSKKDGPPS
jgi:hypothetical protein